MHSYRILPGKTERDIVVANSQYGDNKIPSVIEKGNVFGTQFHPEKSGPIGSQIIKNFLKVCSSTVIAKDKWKIIFLVDLMEGNVVRLVR